MQEDIDRARLCRLFEPGAISILGSMTDSEPGNIKPSQSAERRRGDRRGGDDRRKQELGPPEGIERRKAERRTIDRRRFLQGVAAGFGALVVGSPFSDTVTEEKAAASVALRAVTPINYPVSSVPPSYYVQCRSVSRQGNVYYTGETGRFLTNLGLSVGQGGAGLSPSSPTTPFTGKYYIRNYYGTLVASGKLNHATTVPIPDTLSCGGYRVYLTQSVNDPIYGYSGGSGVFVIVNQDSHFKSYVGTYPQGAAAHGKSGDDDLMHGLTLQGPTRIEIGDPTNNQYLLNGETTVRLLNTWYQAVPDPQRPRPYICSFIDLIAAGAWTTAAQSIVTTLCGTYGVKWYEGPSNEPTGYNAAQVAAQLQTLSAAIKAAEPSALVMGPCPVTFNGSNNQPGTGYIHNVLADMAAMSPVPIDGISFHSYNCHNGDLLLGRTCYQQLVSTISSVGMSRLPLFDTEQGFFAQDYGVWEPRLQGRWTMLMYLLQEQYGIPKEHHILFEDANTGDYTFPSFYESSGYYPAVAMIRAFSAEVWGMPATPTVLDFGNPGNNMMLGSIYTNPTAGNSLIALQSAGSTDLNVRFNVTGASAFTLVDCFGNTSRLTASGGVLSVPTAMEPVYLRVPARATATLIHDWNFATDLATLGTASASGSSVNVSANAKIMVQGPIPSTYYYNTALTARGEKGAPYVDDTDSFPAWASVTWTSAQVLDTVLVIATAPWQGQGTLLDFDVQYLLSDGVTWQTIKTVAEPAKFSTVDDPTATEFGFVTYEGDVGCTVESYFSDRWVFYIPIGQVLTTKGIRVYVLNATFGKDPCIQAQEARGNNASNYRAFGNNFMLRQISVYNSNTP